MPWRAIAWTRAGTSWRWALMKGPQALTTTIAAFAASWRFSNCTVRADDHKNKVDIKAKTEEIRRRVFLEFILPATIVSDSASRARAALASSSVARRVA